MNTYNFTLTFALPEKRGNPEIHLDTLYKTGCDDALIGTGEPGALALGFSRNAKSAKYAIRQAITDVLTAIPGAKLMELKPDLAGISDIAC